MIWFGMIITEKYTLRDQGERVKDKRNVFPLKYQRPEERILRTQ